MRTWLFRTDSFVQVVSQRKGIDEATQGDFQSIRQFASKYTISEGTDSDCHDPSGWAGSCNQPSRHNQPQILHSSTSRASGGIAEAQAQRHLFYLSRRSERRTAARSGHQSTSKDQRCYRLEQVRNPWQGRLEVSQAIFQQPLAPTCQRISGFGIKLNQWRNNGHFSLTNVFENLGIVHGNSPPRPPTNHKDSFSMETNSFPFGGPNMDVVSQETKEKIAVCFGIVACFATIYWGLDWNHWSQIPEEIRLLSGFDWAEFLDLSSLHKVILENRLEFLVSIPVTGSRIIEVLIFAGINTLLSTLLSIWGLNLILQRRDKEISFNPSQDKNHRDLP